MSDNGTIRCYTCAHRHYTDVHGYNPYCESNCGDAWQGYEAEEEDEPSFDDWTKGEKKDDEGSDPS